VIEATKQAESAVATAKAQAKQQLDEATAPPPRPSTTAPSAALNLLMSRHTEAIRRLTEIRDVVTDPGGRRGRARLAGGGRPTGPSPRFRAEGQRSGPRPAAAAGRSSRTRAARGPAATAQPARSAQARPDDGYPPGRGSARRRRARSRQRRQRRPVPEPALRFATSGAAPGQAPATPGNRKRPGTSTVAGRCRGGARTS